jgi:hypothetical protein
VKGHFGFRFFFKPQRRKERRERHATGETPLSKSSFFFRLCALCAFAVQSFLDKCVASYFGTSLKRGIFYFGQE